MGTETGAKEESGNCERDREEKIKENRLGERGTEREMGTERGTERKKMGPLGSERGREGREEESQKGEIGEGIQRKRKTKGGTKTEKVR